MDSGVLLDEKQAFPYLNKLKNLCLKEDLPHDDTPQLKIAKA